MKPARGAQVKSWHALEVVMRKFRSVHVSVRRRQVQVMVLRFVQRLCAKLAEDNSALTWLGFGQMPPPPQVDDRFSRR